MLRPLCPAVAADAARVRRDHRRRVLLEPLERRVLMSGDVSAPNRLGGAAGPVPQAPGENLTALAVKLVDPANNVIPSLVTGQMVRLRAEWGTSGLTAANPRQYIVRFSVDGVDVDTGAISSASNGNGWSIARSGWFASPGNHTVTVTIDAANAVAESNEADNVVSTTFAPAPPSDLPYQLTQPIGARLNRDWVISNYADVDPRTGPRADFNGGPYQYDGHDAIDAPPAGFDRMDAGVPILAAAPGVVIETVDGNFDRETTASNSAPNIVVIDHGNGWTTRYYHLAQGTIAVAVGDTVARGQILALMGSSGRSTFVHLHFALQKNGLNVETGYAPTTYWVQPPPYMGDVPAALMRSSISNYFSLADANERISEIDTFPTTSTLPMDYAFRIINPGPTDVIRVNWYRPNGTLQTFASFSPPNRVSYNIYHYPLSAATYSTAVGTWQVALLINGVEQERRPFVVTAGGGVPEAKLTDGPAADAPMILDGRTTPIQFAGATVGGVGTEHTFTLRNHGYQPLTTSNLSLPVGYSLVGTFPSTVAPGAAGDFTLRLDTVRGGTKFGEVRFNTNDADEGVFTFNVIGTVTGPPPAGAASLSMPGPAAVYWAGAAARLVEPRLEVSGPSSYVGAGLEVSLAGHGTPDDRLTLLAGITPDGPVALEGATVLFNGTPVGTFTGGTGDASPLVVTFNEAATQAAVRAVGRSVAYSNTSAAPDTARRYVRFTVTSATGVTGNLPVKSVIYDTAPRPVLSAIRVGDGTSQQRSRVTSLSVSFDRPVSLAAGAVSLVRLNTGGSGTNDNAPPTDVSAALTSTPTTPDGGLTWRFAVSGAFTQFGSLLDGIYTLSVDPARVSALGVALSGNPTPPAVTPALTFHRLYGDVNGSKDVNNGDFALFRSAMGKSAGDAGFNPAFDFDDSGAVNNADYAQFRNRFLKSFSY